MAGGGQMVVTEREVLLERGYLLGLGSTRLLGEGRYSKVRGAIETSGARRRVAVKILDRNRLSHNFYERYLVHELEVMRSVDHRYIVSLYEHFMVGHKWFMVLELATGGDLEVVVQRRGAQSERQAKEWFHQIAAALAYLHRFRIAHRDIKPANVLVTRVGTGPEELRVADFTFARTMGAEEELSTTYCGSKAYSCPEILSAVPYNPWKADAFAAGVVLFILLVGRMPFNEHFTRQDIVEHQRRGTFLDSLRRVSNLSASARHLVENLLAFHQDNRLDILGAVSTHAWLSGINDDLADGDEAQDLIFPDDSASASPPASETSLL